ncbi:uncharacterized protein C2orf74 homolog [Phyllostomus hastatus]|uniref:uncharacterized protein C2orf74 homolog n=1 Tax=Phyllostomus hastatus TaxID=9423 RepID=UPI001E6823CB|nr:uncharacterized protein C2orf74 homolog [Phyllostomus hastatus]
MSFETTAITFIIILLICFICILLLLMLFLYRCFQSKEDEEIERGTYEDGLTANVKTRNSGDPEKTLIRQIIRPGILVQRQSKEMVATLLENKEGIEGIEGNEGNEGNKGKAENEVKENHDDKNAKENGQEDDSEKPHIPVSGAPSVTDHNKRPLKGVTFSREVIVVDLGKQYPTPQSYIQEHKERK